MTKVSIADLKRKVNGKRVKFIASGVGDQVPFNRIVEILDTPREQSYDTIAFNTVDMIRTMENGESSYCHLKGLKAFMSDKGFVLVAPWGTQANVLVYQF